MPLVTIDYERPETLEMLKELAADYHFKIIPEEKADEISNLIMTSGDPSIKPDDLSDIFAARNIDVKELRKKAWRKVG